MISSLSVVPAEAGTQYPRAFVGFPEHICSVCVYWVPAFAGTTERRNRLAGIAGTSPAMTTL
jgi:hypothetical protein